MSPGVVRIVLGDAALRAAMASCTVVQVLTDGFRLIVVASTVAQFTPRVAPLLATSNGPFVPTPSLVGGAAAPLTIKSPNVVVGSAKAPAAMAVIEMLTRL